MLKLGPPKIENSDNLLDNLRMIHLLNFFCAVFTTCENLYFQNSMDPDSPCIIMLEKLNFDAPCIEKVDNPKKWIINFSETGRKKLCRFSVNSK